MKKMLIALSIIVIMVFALSACNNSNADLQKEIEALKQENEALRNSQTTVVADDDIHEMQVDILSVIWDYAQPEIAEYLKQPDTAEFTDISQVKFYEISKGTYELLGTIKGQNALGNMVSNYFCATVILDSNEQPTMVSAVEFLGEESYAEHIKLNEQLKDRIASGKTYLTGTELDEEIKKQPLYVENTKYLDSDTFSYSSSSMLQAMLYNNSDSPIKSAVVGFVAWDSNNLPVKIKGYISISDGSYFSRIDYDSINLMPGDTYTGLSGDTYSGMQVDKDLQIISLKAIVISFEDFDGNIWDNPLLLDFKHLYEEKRLITSN